MTETTPLPEREQQARAFTAADESWADQIVMAVFHTTKLRCAQAVDAARELVKQSGLLADHPEWADHIDGLLEGAIVKVLEVLLEQRILDDAAKLIAQARADAPRPTSAPVVGEREALLAARTALRDVPSDERAYAVGLIDAALAREQAASPPPVEGAICRHEPYHGRCAHCDAPFVNGVATPKATASPPSEVLEALRDTVAIITGDLSGPSQVAGVLAEARALIAEHDATKGGR